MDYDIDYDKWKAGLYDSVGSSMECDKCGSYMESKGGTPELWLCPEEDCDGYYQEELPEDNYYEPDNPGLDYL